MLASFHLPIGHLSVGLPRNHSGKESICLCQKQRKGRFNHLWRKWQLSPVFLPGKFNGQRSLVGYSPWGLKELDMTKHAHTHTYTHTSMSSLEKCLSKSSAHFFSTGFFVFRCCCYWAVWVVCIFSKLNSCWITSFTNIFSHSVGWLDICLWFPLLCKILKNWLDTISLFFILFLLLWETELRKHWHNLCRIVLPIISSRSLTVTSYVCNPLSHLEIICMDSVRDSSNFIDLHKAVQLCQKPSQKNCQIMNKF